MPETRTIEDPELSGQQIRLIQWSKYLAINVLVIGMLVLAGWEWNIDFFKKPMVHLTAMNPLTALNFLFAAASFLLLSTAVYSADAGKKENYGGPPAGIAARRRLIGNILAVIVLLVGFLRLGGVFPGLHLRPDQVLFRKELLVTLSGNLPNQMAIQSAWCFIFSGISLLTLDRSTKSGHSISQYLALLTAFISSFALIGYLYRVQAFYGPVTYIPMAVHTSACFLLLSGAILFGQPGTGVMKELTGNRIGSTVGRFLLPFAVLLPILLGYLKLLAYWHGLITTEFGVAILVSGIILTFSAIIWFNARLLHTRDQLKQAAERKLVESEEMFRLIVVSVKDYAIFMLNPKGDIVSWNEGAERIKGYKEEEIIGRNMSIFYTPAEMSRGEPHYNLSQAKLYGHYEQEGERVRKDGSIFWANIVFTALHGDDGKLVGFAKVTRDITERKRSEEQITYMARLMEDTSDAIFSTDASFLIRSWNKAAELLFGYVLAEVRGRSAGKILRTQMNEDMIGAIREKMRQTGYWKGEVYYVTKAGTLLTIMLSASGVKDPEGCHDGFVMVCRDFTERKKLELQLEYFNRELEEQVKKKTAEITDYKYALDQSSIVSITDGKGGIISVNENFCQISGYSAGELIGQTHRVVGSGVHPAPFFDDLWDTISKGTVWKGEICNRAKDGTIYWVDTTIVPFLNEMGEPYEYIALDSAITERKKAEALLSQSYHDIRELASHLQDIREEERASIAREIHDELGQQLTGLKMDLSWMSKRKTMQEDNELRQKAIATMSLLDTTIMTIRRISTDLRPSILDDLGLVAAIEWQCQEFERRSGIRTEFACTLTDFHYSPAIAIGLFRICQESLTNVARHAAATHIFMSLQEEINEYILLIIEDNGKGFEVEVTGSNKTLGLLGMKERALMMGGEFKIDSEAGRGTTLLVTVPLNTSPVA
jgi:PAS domain S-box-containing protein